MINKDFLEMCEKSWCSVEDIKSHRRDADLVDERQAIVEGLRGKGYTLTEIAGVMNRDHTSIMHLLNKRGK